MCCFLYIHEMQVMAFNISWYGMPQWLFFVTHMAWEAI